MRPGVCVENSRNEIGLWVCGRSGKHTFPQFNDDEFHVFSLRVPLGVWERCRKTTAWRLHDLSHNAKLGLSGKRYKFFPPRSIVLFFITTSFFLLLFQKSQTTGSMRSGVCIEKALRWWMRTRCWSLRMRRSYLVSQGRVHFQMIRPDRGKSLDGRLGW
jgi:hypothetical protein